MMTAKKFDELVKARARQRVDAKVKRFKQEIDRAYRELTGESICFESYNQVRKLPHAIFTVLASENHRKGWPAWLWKNEEAAVERELLSIMDEMQKALIAVSSKQEYENEQEENGKEVAHDQTLTT